jgi:phosphoglycerate dehydrogenase-like enzyme
MTNSPLSVVVADANLLPHRTLLEDLSPAGTRFTWLERFDEGAVAAALPGAQVLVAPKFTPALTGSADALELVHVAGAGVDGIDVDALPSGVRVANTFHHEGSIAEHIVATTILLRRQILQQDRALREGRWATPVYEPERAQLSSLEGATVGFVGFGHIGRRTWQAYRALGARGRVVSRSGRVPDEIRDELAGVAQLDGLDALLGESDIVILCLPLDESTRELIDADQLRRMRADALLVNVARGPVVAPGPLHDALREKSIGGAVLDTWYAYPSEGSRARPAEQPFEDLDNVVMTPHSSGITAQTFQGRARDIAENISRLADSSPLDRVVIGR